MNARTLFAGSLVALLVCFAVAAAVYAGCGTCGSCATEGKKIAKPQATCPVRGAKIDKKVFADVEGYRVYLCCPACVEKVKADPKKYIAKIRANGETPEQLPKKCKDKKAAKCCGPAEGTCCK